MRNLIGILLILNCFGLYAQNTLPKTSFEIDFNSMELSEVKDNQFISINKVNHLGLAKFVRTDSGYVVTIKSDNSEMDPFNIQFTMKYPVGLIEPKNAWLFKDYKDEFDLMCDSSFRWAYLYAKCLDEYIQFIEY